MYQSSEHAVAIETLKADYENVLERTSNELKMKHEGEIALGKTLCEQPSVNDHLLRMCRLVVF